MRKTVGPDMGVKRAEFTTQTRHRLAVMPAQAVSEQAQHWLSSSDKKEFLMDTI